LRPRPVFRESTHERGAAARFFGFPIGRSVRDKLPKVVDRVMPQIQAELARKAHTERNIAP
jgi:hypothetical protein